jgi:hypothetical protein
MFHINSFVVNYRFQHRWERKRKKTDPPGKLYVERHILKPMFRHKSVIKVKILHPYLLAVKQVRGM